MAPSQAINQKYLLECKPVILPRFSQSDTCLLDKLHSTRWVKKAAKSRFCPPEWADVRKIQLYRVVLSTDYERWGQKNQEEAVAPTAAPSSRWPGLAA
jgi:hypothetical protein